MLKSMAMRALTDLNDNAFPPAARPEEPVGIGLRTPHYEEVLDTPLSVGWVEVHPENYFGGGAHRHFLAKARERYQISLHAVGLSLGSDQPVSDDHLARFRALIEIYDPFQISDHASWSASGNAHLNDLLPLPYCAATLDRLARNVERAQDALGRRMLIENPSTYLAFKGNEMHEDVFMNRLAAMTGCGILLDLNNIYVQAHNHGYDAWSYIETIEPRHVGEMHLAGHIEQEAGGAATILVDTHSRPVKGDVWDLYEHAVRRMGVVPTLIEWDNDIPDLATLVGEADKARAIIRKIEAESIPDAAE